MTNRTFKHLRSQNCSVPVKGLVQSAAISYGSNPLTCGFGPLFNIGKKMGRLSTPKCSHWSIVSLVRPKWSHWDSNQQDYIASKILNYHIFVLFNSEITFAPSYLCLLAMSISCANCLSFLCSMDAANAGWIDHTQPGPIDDSVLKLQPTHRSEAIWNGQVQYSSKYLCKMYTYLIHTIYMQTFVIC